MKTVENLGGVAPFLKALRSGLTDLDDFLGLMRQQHPSIRTQLQVGKLNDEGTLRIKIIGQV